MSPPRPDDAWERAPVGLLRLDLDGQVIAANGTLRSWLGSAGQGAVGQHVSQLLSVGGRIYWETHLSPLLLVDGQVDEVAIELCAAAHRMPVLLSAVVVGGCIEVAVSRAQERLRYERELQAAQRAARTSEQQVRALQTVTAGLSEAVGVEAVARELLTAATGPLGAAGGTLWLAGADGRLEQCGSTGTAAATQPEPDPEVALAAGSEPGSAARATGGADGEVLLPLRGLHELRGALVLRPPTAAGADPIDLEVCTAVAQQAGLALDRARTYEQSAAVAHQLQAALLAVEPPPDSRYGVATFYRPGVESLEVGGDWFDVFLSSPGVLCVLVGDVVGRGLSAASAMGQLRSAVRALAASDSGPGRLLSQLDRFVGQVPAAGMATLAYAEVHLVTGRVRYACAGHPPPVLVPAAGPARLLWEGRSTPLGALIAPRERPEAELLLSPGDRLLLCTDGLFERRGEDIDDGLQRLLVRTAGCAAAPLEDCVRAVTDSLLAGERSHDDVCALLLQWRGDRFEHHLSADLTGLSEARRALGAWLGERGVREPVRADLVLAASEALANAGEHGSGGRREERISLSAWLQTGESASDEVVLSVTDQGRWRTPAAPLHERGRGLTIIRAMVDEVDVQAGAGTTVVLRRRLELAS